MVKKKVMIIAHFCDYGKGGNNRFNYIATLLSQSGFDVELVTSSFSHVDKKQRVQVKKQLEPYHTVLIHEPGYKRNVSIKRLFYSHPQMARNLSSYLQQCKKPDVVYCAIPSLSVAQVAAEFCKENNIKFIIDVQDLWPEAFQMAFNIPVLSDIIFYPFKQQANCIYTAADEIVGVSETYVTRALSVNKKCTRGHVVFLGTDLKIFDYYARFPLKLEKKRGKFWLGYCGTLGASYDLRTVIYALEKLGNNAPTFIIMGDGPKRQELERIAKQKNVDCIFTGRLPYKEMCPILKSCDIAINPIIKGSAASIINKHADYAAAGIPVINTQENWEYRSLIEKYNCGINCEVESIEQLSQAIKLLLMDKKKRKIMGGNSRKLAEDKFNREYTYKLILSLL